MSNPQAPLTGKELLERVKELGNLSKTEMVQACGYATTAKGGKVRTNFTAFYEALLEAKGMSFGEERPAKGRQASYRVKVQGNGNLLIGSAYTKKMGLKAGDEFQIKLGRKQISLIPTWDGSEDEDEADEDE
jgi:hypothetical protein